MPPGLGRAGPCRALAAGPASSGSVPGLTCSLIFLAAPPTVTGPRQAARLRTTQAAIPAACGNVRVSNDDSQAIISQREGTMGLHW